MKAETPTIIVTEDGSKTLYLPELNEHYHSSHGAVAESKHIFIDAGFKVMFGKACSLTILEMGFGTGLNALMTFFEARHSGKKNGKVHYVAAEAFPVERSIWTQLDYPLQFQDTDAGDIFMKMHDSPWDLPYFISDDFVLNKVKASFEDLEFKEESFDLVYYDAFAPDIQPELWSDEMFARVFKAVRPGGILVTYSAKGFVKRALQMAGFVVESLPGPKGKREITRAVRPAAS